MMLIFCSVLTIRYNFTYTWFVCRIFTITYTIHKKKNLCIVTVYSVFTQLFIIWSLLCLMERFFRKIYDTYYLLSVVYLSTTTWCRSIWHIFSVNYSYPKYWFGSCAFQIPGYNPGLAATSSSPHDQSLKTVSTTSSPTGQSGSVFSAATTLTSRSTTKSKWVTLLEWKFRPVFYT